MRLEYLKTWGLVWGIDSRTGFPVAIDFSYPRPNYTNILLNILLPTDSIKEYLFSEDGGETWEKVHNPDWDKIQVVVG